MAEYEFLVEGEVTSCSLEKHEHSFTAVIGERAVELIPQGSGQFVVIADGRRKLAAAAFDRGVWYVDVDSVQLEVREPDESGVAGGPGDQAAEKDKVYAPMPGKIVKVLVEVGDEVAEKQPLIIVEAMKMENQVNAAAKGKVKAVNFQAGDQVDTETPLIELEIEEDN